MPSPLNPRRLSQKSLLPVANHDDRFERKLYDMAGVGSKHANVVLRQSLLKMQSRVELAFRPACRALPFLYLADFSPQEMHFVPLSSTGCRRVEA